MEIKIGQTLRDATTGFTGIAINKTEYMNGNIQFCLQPPATAGVPYPDPISIDFHLLDYVDDGVSARATESTFVSPVQLGNEVMDIVTGHRGIATLKTYYLNGCAAYLVTGKLKPDGEAMQDWVDQHRLSIVGEGIAAVYKKPEPKNGKPSGGPVLRGIPRSC